MTGSSLGEVFRFRVSSNSLSSFVTYVVSGQGQTDKQHADEEHQNEEPGGSGVRNVNDQSRWQSRWQRVRNVNDQSRWQKKKKKMTQGWVVNGEPPR